MPTTSNFGWTTPADTDLVKDGASAIRTLGNGIDSSFIDLKGGTTGQVLTKATNTDLDFTWVDATQGDITGVTAGTGISGGGTSGTVTITNSMATEITASGDIIVGTGSGTFDNLPIGTTGQVLTADTTVSPYKVKWASVSSGGRTLLASQTISSLNSFEFTNIASGYNQLDLIVTGTNSNDDTYFYVYFNNDQTGKYNNNGTQGAQSTTDRKVMINNGMGNTSIGASFRGGFIPCRYNGSTQQSARLTIFNADETTMPKVYKYEGMGWADSSDNYVNAQGWGCYTGTSAISRITVTGTGNATPYWTGVARLYGVK